MNVKFETVAVFVVFFSLFCRHQAMSRIARKASPVSAREFARVSDRCQVKDAYIGSANRELAKTIYWHSYKLFSIKNLIALAE